MNYNTFEEVFIRVPTLSFDEAQEFLDNTDQFISNISKSEILMEGIRRSSKSLYNSIIT
jgi:hypothetical protein